MMSLNARMIAVASLVLAVFVALTGWALDRAFRESALSARQERLLGQVYLLIAAADVDPEGRLSVPAFQGDSRLRLPGSGLYAYITDHNGNLLWRSPSAIGTQAPHSLPLPPGHQRFAEADQNDQHFFIQSMGVTWATGPRHYDFTFSVTEDTREFRAQIARYRENLWGWLVGMSLLLLGAQGLALRWGLRPLRRVAGELAAMEQGDKDRIEGLYPSEIRPLTDNLNALLQRERTQLQRYRNGLGDLAHSLKTPLAVLRGAVRDPSTSLATAVEEEVEKMDRIVAYQLQRAATAGPSAGLAAPVPVKEVAERIGQSLAKVYREKAAELRVDLDANLYFRGDQGDLTEILGNLMDNALKWCKTRVEIRGQRLGPLLEIRVEDDGPGIAPNLARQIMERGVRADEAVPGHGIGLAIVRDIVTAYGGRVEIGQAPLGGASVRISLKV